MSKNLPEHCSKVLWFSYVKAFFISVVLLISLQTTAKCELWPQMLVTFLITFSVQPYIYDKELYGTWAEVVGLCCW